jgi:hypothetical protein
MGLNLNNPCSDTLARTSTALAEPAAAVAGSDVQSRGMGEEVAVEAFSGHGYMASQFREPGCPWRTCIVNMKCHSGPVQRNQTPGLR